MENGMDGSIPGGLSHTQKMTLSQTGFRSGSQLNLTGKFLENFCDWSATNSTLRVSGYLETDSVGHDKI